MYICIYALTHTLQPRAHPEVRACVLQAHACECLRQVQRESVCEEERKKGKAWMYVFIHINT